jgi:NADH dehydrogenase
VEIAGALADMRQFILPKDYNELDKQEVDIYLVDSGNKLLAAFDEKSSLHAERDLESLGIHILKENRVIDYDGLNVAMSDGKIIRSRKLIWAAGITVKKIDGLEDVYAIGDCAIMVTDDKPNGDPQVAQVAMQQAVTLAKNLKAMIKGTTLKTFHYHDKGIMATIGRKKAVAEVFGVKFGGFFAWLTWLFVHLMSILGTKNKLMIFINWTVAYFTRDQSLRLIIKAKENKSN